VVYVYLPLQKITNVPGNVIILMESVKPNYGNYMPTTYKPYYSSWPDLFLTPALPAAKNTASANLTFNRIGTYHVHRTQLNVVFADGHIATVDPRKSFFSNPLDQRTVKEYLWDQAVNAGTVTSSPTYQNPPSVTNGGWKPGVPAGF
jgi:prepilin-type processing-associated H-X9-DG protein